eukprot:Tbor_TRINITY_DN5705_c3_g1::TRINITY_DN5705_c3_g1_i1::g.20603::m.20603
MSGLERSADALLAQKAVQSSNYERLQSNIDQQTRSARTLVMTGKMATSDLCRINEEIKDIETRGERLGQRLNQLKDRHTLVTHSTNSETEKALSFFKKHAQSVVEWNEYAVRVATALGVAKAGEQLELANKRAFRLLRRVYFYITGIHKIHIALVASNMVCWNPPITENSVPDLPLYNLYLNRTSNSLNHISTSSEQLSDTKEHVFAHIKYIDALNETMTESIAQLHSKKNITVENTLTINAESEAKSVEVSEKEAVIALFRERKEKREQKITDAQKRLADATARRDAAEEEGEKTRSKLAFIKKEISCEVERIQLEEKEAQSRILEKKETLKALEATLAEKQDTLTHQKRVMYANLILRAQQEKHTEAVNGLKTEAFEKLAALCVRERESEIELKHEEHRRDQICLIIQNNRLAGKIELQHNNDRGDVEKSQDSARTAIFSNEADERESLRYFMTQIVALFSAEVGARGQIIAEEDQERVKLEELRSNSKEAAYDLEQRRQYVSPGVKVNRSMELSGAYDSPIDVKTNIVSDSSRMTTILAKNSHTLLSSEVKGSRSLLMGGGKPIAYLRPVQANTGTSSFSAMLDDVVAPNPTKRIHGMSQKAQIPRLSTGVSRPSSGVTKSALRDDSEGSIISLFRDPSVVSQHPSLWQPSSFDISNLAAGLKGTTSSKKKPIIKEKISALLSKENKIVSPAKNNDRCNSNASSSEYNDDDDMSVLQIANSQTDITANTNQEPHHTHISSRQNVVGKRTKRSPKTENPILMELCEGSDFLPSSANTELPSPSPRRPPFRRTEPLPQKALPRYASRKVPATDPRKMKAPQDTHQMLTTPAKQKKYPQLDVASPQSTIAAAMKTPNGNQYTHVTNITQALMDVTNKTPQASQNGSKKSSKIDGNTQEMCSPALSASRRMLALVGASQQGLTPNTGKGCAKTGGSDNVNIRDLSMDNIYREPPSSISTYSTQLNPRRIIAPSSSSEVGDDLF